jgi:hypothetical protein
MTSRVLALALVLGAAVGVIGRQKNSRAARIRIEQVSRGLE